MAREADLAYARGDVIRLLVIAGTGLACAIVAAIVYLAQATAGSTATPSRQRANATRGDGVVPKDPESLAMGPNGVLYIADPGRQQILERLPSGRFEVAVGTGIAGDSGDGGLATRAEVDDPSSMVVTRNGALYFVQQGTKRPASLAGSSVVREVTPNGKVSTVIGAHPDCRGSGVTAQHAPAEDADLPGGASLAIAPNGELTLAATTCPNVLDGGPLLQLTAGGELIDAPQNSIVAKYVNCDGPLAYSGSGALYVACVDGGGNTRYGHPNDLLLVESNGRTRQFGVNPHNAPNGLTTAPNGTIFTIYYAQVFRVTPQGARMVISLGGDRPYDKFLGKINGIPGRMEPSGIAVDRHGDIYLCTGSDGNGTFNGIIEVHPKGRVQVLWSRPSRTP